MTFVLGLAGIGQTIQPGREHGARLLTETQRGMLLDLAAEWTGIMSEGAAKIKLDELKQHLSETWLAWSGPSEKGKGYFSYSGTDGFYRIRPPKIWGGDMTKHIHTIYREPNNDYGTNWLK